MLYFSKFLYFYVFSSKNWKWCKKPYPCFTPSAVNFCLHFSTMPTFLSRRFQHFIRCFLATCFSYKPLITNLNIEIWRFMYFFMSVYWKKVDFAVQEKLVFQKGYKKAKNLSFKKARSIKFQLRDRCRNLNAVFHVVRFIFETSNLQTI